VEFKNKPINSKYYIAFNGSSKAGQKKIPITKCSIITMLKILIIIQMKMDSKFKRARKRKQNTIAIRITFRIKIWIKNVQERSIFKMLIGKSEAKRQFVRPRVDGIPRVVTGE
jgi:hypothetical protein